MTKKDFLVIYNTANYAANNAFNKLGLKAKFFTNAFKSDFEVLADEEYYLRAELAEKDNGVPKKDQSGQLIINYENEKKLMVELKKWKLEEFVLDKSKLAPFVPTEKDEKCFLISPEIYETLNGFVFDLNEEKYLEILLKQQKT